MLHVFNKYDVGRYVQFETAVSGCYWSEDLGKWRVEWKNVKTGETGEVWCDVLCNGQGVLNRPKYPEIEGLQDVFKGRVVHTANWDPETDDPTGKERVAVIGNGSTG